MKVDLEVLKALGDLMRPREDKDSFAVFRGGLKENWPYLMAIAGFCVWLLTSLNAVQNTNAFQEQQIKSNIDDIAQNAADIEQNAKNIQTLNALHVSNYNDVVRRLDSLQASLDNLTNK